MDEYERIYKVNIQELKMIPDQMIVRCKDCKKRYSVDCQMFLEITDENWHHEWTKDDGFCQEGERK